MSLLNLHHELRHIWAKKASSDSMTGESLLEHTWNVLKRLEEHIKIRPYMADILQFPRLWHCLFWGSFMHDFGKICRPFQDGLRDGKPWTHRHEVYSLLFLNWLEGTCEKEELNWIMAAIVSHHKEPFQIFDLYDVYDEYTIESFDSVIKDLDKSVLALLYEWVFRISECWLHELGLQGFGIVIPKSIDKNNAIGAIYHHGPQRLRFWVQQYGLLVRNLKRETKNRVLSLTIRGFINMCDYAASASTGEVFAADLPTSDILLSNFMRKDKLYTHQKQCLFAEGSTLLIAPTGSGKTESSLLWAINQRSKYDRPARLFYMLPYQASMNAMYDRLNRIGFKGHVGLEHGRSVLSLYRRNLDESGDQDSAAFNAKLAKKLARFNYYPVRVLSPYQLLKALFRLKTYEQILSDYFNSVIVFDEIHAYEPQKLALILGLARFLKDNFNTRFFIMTATLPTMFIEKLDETLGIENIIKADENLCSRFTRHCIRIIDDEILSESSIKQIVNSVIDGKSALVCCNTVKHAQLVFQSIKEKCMSEGKSIEVLLLHGRFNNLDRAKIEKKVIDFTGAHSKKQKNIILISTQVVEVSLDIDLDVIFTEPAPLEALLQRFGRVNRRLRHGVADVFIFSKPNDGQEVYLDQLVSNALDILIANNNLPINELQVTNWLDEVYKGEVRQIWENGFNIAYSNFMHGNLPLLYGFNTNVGMEKDFYQAFDSIEVLPAPLLDKYNSLLNRNPIIASELLVPIRPGQLKWLKSWRHNHITVVDAEYNEMGLCF
ncbi:MAG: CRISPR-associated helicase Cas3' [Bacillota bacterium]